MNYPKTAKGYPATPHFLGLNEPLGVEWEETGLEVEGRIPDDVRGTFFRAVPDPKFPTSVQDDTVLSGDGMVSKFVFKDDGSVDGAIRYVGTARHLAEMKAGRALFGKYRNKYTDDPSVAEVDRTVANTTPVWHAGKLIMTKEDGRGYQVDPVTLDTIGSYDFDGGLKSETMTAHVRIDPMTGEMFFYGYEAAGLATKTIAYCIVDKAGKLVREQWFDAPYAAMMHDFAITQNYALFPIFPTVVDHDVLKAGGEHWIHHQDWDSWLGVMPRYGDVSEVRWFKGPKGVHAYHMMNAFEDADGRIHLDQCLSASNAFSFIREASGLDLPQQTLGGGLTRWTVDYDDPSAGVSEVPLGPPGDMPRVPDAVMGRPYTDSWYCSINPNGPPVFGGIVGVCFTLLFYRDNASGALMPLAMPPGLAINEPVHIPSSTPGHKGWLMAVVDEEGGPEGYRHALWIIDGGNVAAGPVAKVKVPRRLRPQVHGWWVPKTQLATG